LDGEEDEGAGFETDGRPKFFFIRLKSIPKVGLSFVPETWRGSQFLRRLS